MNSPARVRIFGGLHLPGLLLMAGIGWGCASQAGPQVVTIGASQYDAAFDAAVEAARRHRMPATTRDRRGGTIGTAPALAASVLEPWRGDNASLSQALDNTIDHHRRWARFEFVPADPLAVSPRLGRGDGVENIASRDGHTHSPAPPAEPGAHGPGTDLTNYSGPLELRVTVVVQRAYMPGLRYDTWTQAKISYSQIIPPGEPPTPVPSMYWMPVDRDEAMERRLLAEVNATVNAASQSPAR